MKSKQLKQNIEDKGDWNTVSYKKINKKKTKNEVKPKTKTKTKTKKSNTDTVQKKLTKKDIIENRLTKIKNTIKQNFKNFNIDEPKKNKSVEKSVEKSYLVIQNILYNLLFKFNFYKYKTPHNNILNFPIVVGGYAIHLQTNKKYPTDDIDVKIYVVNKNDVIVLRQLIEQNIHNKIFNNYHYIIDTGYYRGAQSLFTQPIIIKQIKMVNNKIISSKNICDISFEMISLNLNQIIEFKNNVYMLKKNYLIDNLLKNTEPHNNGQYKINGDNIETKTTNTFSKKFVNWYYQLKSLTDSI